MGSENTVYLRMISQDGYAQDATIGELPKPEDQGSLLQPHYPAPNVAVGASESPLSSKTLQNLETIMPLIENALAEHGAQGMSIIVSVGIPPEQLNAQDVMSRPMPAQANPIMRVKSRIDPSEWVSYETADVGDIRGIAAAGTITTRIHDQNIYIDKEIIETLRAAQASTDTDPEPAFLNEQSPFTLEIGPSMHENPANTQNLTRAAAEEQLRMHHEGYGLSIATNVGPYIKSLQSGDAILIDLPPVQRDLPSVEKDQATTFSFVRVQ